MATDFDSLVDRGTLSSFAGQVATRSCVMSVANVQPMGSEAYIPVASALPVAAFVTPRYGGRKPATVIEWTSENIVAEEIAAVVAVPTQWINDATFDVEGQTEQQLAAAVARAFDAAVLFGTGAPASYPVGGLDAIAGNQTGASMALAISNAMGAIEATGLTPDGIISGTSVSAALRAAYLTAGELPSTAPMSSLWGLQVCQSPVWDSAKGDALVGDFDYLVVGLHRDVTIETSTDGILQDGAGEIIANAFQDNVTLVKAFTKVGVAVGIPVQGDGSGAAVPFSMADWTA